MKDLSLNGYDFEKPNMCLKTDKFLLDVAKHKGFYNGRTKYNDLFSKLFYSGGKLNYKKDLAEDTGLTLM